MKRDGTVVGSEKELPKAPFKFEGEVTSIEGLGKKIPFRNLGEHEPLRCLGDNIISVDDSKILFQDVATGGVAVDSEVLSQFFKRATVSAFGLWEKHVQEMDKIRKTYPPFNR